MNSTLSKLLEKFRGEGLAARSLRGSSWTTIGFGASQLIRLLSNLLLTRLLFPEAFGLMAIIQVLMQGLAMFSDVGLGSSIIQNDRGGNSRFLNTAWTLQVLRGLGLFIFTCLIAIPAADLYDEAILIQLMPVAGLNAVIAGFNPTKIFSANRDLLLGRLTVIELAAQTTSVVTCIFLAWSMRSVWALVLGGLVGSLVKLLLVQKFLPGPGNNFDWDKESLTSLIRFGKWIFLSSIAGFLAQQGDKLILASFMSTAELGVYSVAFFLASSPLLLSQKLNQLIFFPLYSRLKHLSSVQLRPRVVKARIAVCALLLPPLVIFIIFGNYIVTFLYDERYREAGWIMQMLSVGYAISVGTNIGPFYLARGNSKLYLQIVLIKGLTMILSMIFWGCLYGVTGVIIGLVAANAIFYLFSSAIYHHFGLWLWKLDMIVFAAITSSAVVGYRILHT